MLSLADPMTRDEAFGHVPWVDLMRLAERVLEPVEACA